jgi:Cu+-exporting ATPase
MISLEKGAESYISKIRKNTQNLLSSRSTTIIWTDKIASAFFSVVILLSIACFYVYSENTVEAFSNSIAMLLVACPCSFAIAVPLAYSKAIATGIKNQVAFKSLNSIDKLSRVSKFIFDKTGTLTMGKPEVVNMRLDPQVIKQQELVELFNALAPAANHHSVSATLDYLKKSHTTKSKINELHITNVQVITGKGIQGFLNNKKIKVGSSEFTGTVGEDNFNLFFTIDGSEAAAFQIEDALHQDSKDIISDLKKSGHDLLILTGDKKAPSLKIASELDLEPSHVNYEHTPDDKQELISNLSSGDSVAMIGDGMNDALAVGKSSVGINVSNSSNFLKETSDISLLRPGIKGVADALLISNQTKTSLYAAFTFAGLYNVAGVTLSFMGIISPLIAAITMPINSVVVSYLSVIFIKGGK